MITLLQGDCRDVLQALPAQSVQCVVTSPPYYGLRKYSDDPREIGQEATPALYVSALVEVFRQVKRVLRDDGVVWLNLGDSYVTTTRGSGGHNPKQDSNRGSWFQDRRAPAIPEGLKEKDLMGIPWRVAFALQDDGWYLRSDIIWNKPNCMPESVTDRPTHAHEYVFLLTKSARYFYDAAAIAEPVTQSSIDRAQYGWHGQVVDDRKLRSSPEHTDKLGERFVKADGTRNKRTVWTIATQPYSGAHYATMPEALIEPCILAGSAAQACETCGAAWGRVVERECEVVNIDEGQRQATRSSGAQTGGTAKVTLGVTEHVKRRDLGFAPRCACTTNTGSAASVVLDPFGGSGTVGKVALRYQRSAVLIELNQAYIDDHIETRTDGLQVEMFV